MKLQINIQQYRVTSNFLFLAKIFSFCTGVLLLPFVLFTFTIPNVYVYVMYVLMYCVVPGYAAQMSNISVHRRRSHVKCHACSTCKSFHNFFDKKFSYQSD